MSAEAIARIERGLEDGLGVPVTLERPGQAEHGDYATNAALQAAPVKRKPPMEIAEELRAAAVGVEGVAEAQVAAPGFVNLWMSPAWYGEALADVLSAGSGYGGGSAETRERVQVELVSANPTGPVTVASARNGAYGDSVARLLAFAGHEVSREHYVNDAGGQIDLFRESVAARARGEDPPEGGYTGDYLERLAGQDADPVRLMIEELRASLARFRVEVDDWVLESELDVEGALTALEGHTFEREGALWLRTTEFGDDKDRPRSRLCAHSLEVRARLRAPHLRPGRRPPRLHRAVEGARRRARPRPGFGRGSHLPARTPRRRGTHEADVEAPR
jgi:arginyl-tRNA synthetase